MTPEPYAEPAGDERQPLAERIRLRAYELYMERGGQPGLELDDWLQAEQEILGLPALRPDVDH